jgi:IPT/TIG domain
MIILPDRNIARQTKYLKPIPRKQWYGPHPYGPDVKLEFNTWIAQAYRADHSMVWHGHFEDRDDADAFMWALYSGTLKNDPYLKRLPRYCYTFDQRQIPLWAPGGFDPEILEEFGIMYNMVSNIGIGPSDGAWYGPGDFYGLASRAGEFVDAIGPGGGGGAAFQSMQSTGGGGGGFARIYSLPGGPGSGYGYGVGNGGAGGAATPDARGGAGGTAHTWFWQQQNPGLRAHAAGGGNVANSFGGGCPGGGGGGADAGAYGHAGGRGGGRYAAGQEFCNTGGGGAAGPGGPGGNGGDPPPYATGGGGSAGNVYGPWGPGAGGAGVAQGANGVTGGHGAAYGGGGGAASQNQSTYWHQYGGNGAGGLIVIRYEPQYAPAVYWISPNSGPTAGGQAVRINGSYTSPTAADIGGAYLTGVSANATDFYGTTAPGGAGTYNVSVHRSGGPSPGVLGSAYTYVSPPSVSSAAPSSGPTGGGNYVAIYGANMGGVTAIYFNGVPATSISNISASGVQCYAPAGAAGACSIAVYNGYGGGAGTVYTYVTPPSLSAVSSPVPAIGLIFGGTTITLTGANLAGTTAVTVGGVAATDVVAVNANTVTCKTPAHAAGLVSITATNGYGTATLANCFTYLLPASGFNMPMMGI